MMYISDKKLEEIYKTADDNVSKIESDFEERIEEAALAITKMEELLASSDEYNIAKIDNKIRKKMDYGEVSVVELTGCRWGVFKGMTCIVPFGKYAWIDGFDCGLARVRTAGRTTYTKHILAMFEDGDLDRPIVGQENIQSAVQKALKEHPEQFAKWGIIDEEGNEVLPVEYDEVWNFYGKNKLKTKVTKCGKIWDIYFDNLKGDDPMSEATDSFQSDGDCDSSDSYFSINNCYDYEGNFDYDRLEDAILDGEYVPEDW